MLMVNRLGTFRTDRPALRLMAPLRPSSFLIKPQLLFSHRIQYPHFQLRGPSLRTFSAPQGMPPARSVVIRVSYLIDRVLFLSGIDHDLIPVRRFHAQIIDSLLTDLFKAYAVIYLVVGSIVLGF